MTYTEIASMLETVAPSAYYQFPNDSGQEPPFICFYYPSTNDFIADSTNYARIEELVIELYTDEKDFALEQTLEAVLSGHGLVYARTEDEIESERMHRSVYSMEVIINA